MSTFQAKFKKNNNVTANICKIQANGSIVCGYVCIGSIDFMINEKYLLYYTYLFSPKKHEEKEIKLR